MVTNGPRVCSVAFLLVLSLMMPVVGQDGDLTGERTSSPSGLIVQEDGADRALALDAGEPFHRTVNAVVNARLIDVPDSSVRLALWSEELANGQVVPFYAISLDGRSVKTVRRTSYVLKVRHGDFDPGVRVPPVMTSLAAGEATNLYIVQFVTQPLEEFRTAIESLGGTVYQFLANHAHIVKMSPEVREQVAAFPYVRWIGPYHPAYRLEEFMRDNQARAAELFPLQRYNIQVFEAGLAQKTTVAGRITALGGTVNVPDAGKFLLEATLTPPQLFQVVRWDDVLFVDRWGPYEKDMNNAREYGGANYIETVAGFTGQGVRGEVYDAGFNVNHVDFASRPLLIHGTAGSDSHGAATSGICFGDGTGNPDARGLLPDGQGIVSNYSGTMGDPSRYAHTGELLQAPYFGVFQTSSVGSPRTTQYTTISADTDAALFDFDVVHCQSQSNAGNQNSRPQAWAKNIISGGAARHYDTLDPSDDCWCGGASIGPATDGRIKPDLCAYYDDILTVGYPGSTAYTYTFGGTSGATPIICGHVGLFFQMWSEGIFGNEVPVPGGTVFENRAHMTTAKAVMINTAQQYPFTGTGHDLTRVHQGWGWPDLGYLYDMRENMIIIDETDLVANLDTMNYFANVAVGEPALRVTLIYADPPGVPSSSQHRINDLTLKVTSPSGTVYWGNHGLLEGNWSVSGGAANEVDTVENVFIEDPEAGVWAIDVIASEIVQDGHVETPDLDADFALVVTGASPGPRPPRVLNLAVSTAVSTPVTIAFPASDDGLPDPPAAMTLIITSLPAHGELTDPGSGPITSVPHTLTSNGLQVEYQPEIDYHDTDSFEYKANDGGAPPEGGDSNIATVTVTMGGPAWDPVAYNVEWSTGMNIPTDIPLLGSDPNGDPLFYIIESLPAHGTLSDPGAGAITTAPYELVGGGSMVHYEPPPGQNLQLYFDFSVRDATVGSNVATVSLLVGGPSIVHYYPMDSDPGWSKQGEWAFGQPTGGGGEFGGPDPTTGHFGANVYGYNLNGDYANSLPTRYLTTPWLDFTGAANVELRFWRWLGVESSLFDRAKVQVCNDPFGGAWTTLWENGVESMWDTEWTEMVFDLSAVADDRSAVSIRWVMGPTDVTNTYCGWNIDDIEIWALVAQPESCEDGIQNQGEDRIDCGGPCPPCDCLSDGECADGEFCTGVETCDDYGRCQPGAPVDCDDGLGCTVDSCDEVNDVCVNAVSNGLCDDGEFCNGAEICDPILDCLAGEYPCGPDAWCDEGDDACVPHGNGDFDSDGDIDLGDFADFQICFEQSALGGCEPGNMTGADEMIDLADFAVFVAALGAGGPL